MVNNSRSNNIEFAGTGCVAINYKELNQVLRLIILLNRQGLRVLRKEEKYF